MSESKIILFDGVCNLCNQSVQKIITLDKKNLFKFSSLQSNFGQNFLAKNKLDTNDFDTILLIENNKYYTKSSAALRIINSFGGVYRLASIFLIIPKFLRDIIYNIIAKNRYHWFGKQASCWLPTPELKDKFIP